MKILLTGADGQVGWELRRSLACLGQLHATTRASLDLSQPTAIRSLMRELRPDLVINAAAYTAVDKAETEEALAFAVNAEAPRVLAEEAERLGAGQTLARAPSCCEPPGFTPTADVTFR